MITYAGVYRKGSADQNYSWDDTWYNGCGVVNATTYNTMYNKMLSCVYTNGGFWIQRYEDGTQNIDCANAQKKASEYAPDTTKTSSLLFGIQWDLVCKYLEGKEGLTTAMINSDSSSWGRYNLGTAQSGQYKKMNIYDFAGNYAEWTLELVANRDDTPCSHRGGYYNFPGSLYPASSRLNAMINGGSGIISFRATFY